MKGKLQLLFIAIVAYLLGCVLRYKRCQAEWRDRHPYSYTGREITPGPAVISSMRPRDPDMDVVKTTPVLQKPTQVVEKKGPILKKTDAASVSTGDFSIPERDPARNLEKKSPVDKKSDPALEKTINTIPAIRMNSKHSRPKKTTSTPASEVTKTDSKKKDLTTPFPDDPPAGFNALGVEWRRDEGPGKMFADFTNQFKKDSTTATTEPSASMPTSTSEPEALTEVIQSTNYWSWIFGEKAETAQPPASVSTFKTEPEASPEVTQSPSLWSQIFGSSEKAETKEPLASVSTSTTEPKASLETTESPSRLSGLFGTSEEAETAQSLTSVSSSTTKSMGPKEIIRSASSLFKSKTAENTFPTLSQPDVDQSSGGFFGGFIDWVTGKAYPTDDSEDANRHEPRIPKLFGFGSLSETSTTSSLTESEVQSESTTSEKWYNYFRRASDINHSTTSSTVTPDDQPETSTEKSIADESPSKKSKSEFTKSSVKPRSSSKPKESGPTPRAKTDSYVEAKPSAESKSSKKSKSSADRKTVTELSPSTDNQQATECQPTAEHKPTKEGKQSAKPEPKQRPAEDAEDAEENIPKEEATKSSSRPKWRWTLAWMTGTVYVPHPTFVFLDPGNPPILNQE